VRELRPISVKSPDGNIPGRESRIKRTQERPNPSDRQAVSIKNLTKTLESAKTSVHAARASVGRSAKRHTHVITPLLVAGLLLGVVFMGRPERFQPGDTAQAFAGGLANTSSVDAVSSADIAARIAVGVELMVADSVQNLAESQRATVDFSTDGGRYLFKPQVVKTGDSREIIDYTVQPGDTLSSVAREFNITSDTIKWENDLTSNSLAVGTRLRILPISGIAHTVNLGDTPQSLAELYKANASLIIAFNDAELSGLQIGSTIIIPNGRQNETRFFSTNSGFTFTSSGRFGGFVSYSYQVLPIPPYQDNSYSSGYCTWWAAYRARQLGNPVPRQLGDAYAWNENSGNRSRSVAQILVGGIKIPVGAVAQTDAMGGLGHVAVVEAVSANGKLMKYSDMNGLAGWGTPAITTEWVPITTYQNYIW